MVLKLLKLEKLDKGCSLLKNQLFLVIQVNKLKLVMKLNHGI